MSETQNFENHAKLVPAFHFFVLPVLLINVGWSVDHMAHAFSVESAFALILAIALIVLALTARIFALTVQDRIIRLEMRLRMQRVLPEDLRSRIPEFAVGQLVALRFASDEELPELSRKVLHDGLTNRKAIKKMIRNWQPDLLRA